MSRTAWTRLTLVLVAGLTAALVWAISAGGADASGLSSSKPVTAAPASVATAPASVAGSAPVGRAWQWIQDQRGSATTVTSDSTITADRVYPADWTGPVSGTFTPHGVSSQVVHSSSIAVDSPAQVGPSYAGVLSGHVTVTPQSQRWIVQVYRDTAAGRVQQPLQTLAAADGTFSLNLAAIADPPAGTWALGLLDADNSYAPSGTPWPGDTYADWQIRAYVVTDTAYLVGEQPASADDTFHFTDSRPGTKIFQLVDTSSGDVLAEDAPDFGLVRSFAGSSQVYTYDQALALITGVALGADSADLTSGLMSLQRPDGGFVQNADVRNPAAAAPIVRTGISAIATYALLRRLQTMDPNDPSRGSVRAAAVSGVQWLLAQRRSDGLLGAGSGDYSSDGSVDPSANPGWVSTEHNLDGWQALHLAGIVLGDATDTAAADGLEKAVVSTLWDGTDGRFQQGIAADGSADRTDPLDVSSWGVLFLLATGHDGLAASAMSHVDAFASSTGNASGYRAYYPQPAFPTAKANVWVEGSAGVALARLRDGETSRGTADLAALGQLQNSDGSFPYATANDTATSMTTSDSVTATAWFILASLPQSAPTIW